MKIIWKMIEACFTTKKLNMPSKVKLIRNKGNETKVDTESSKLPKSQEEIKDLFNQLLNADQKIKEAIKDGDIEALKNQGFRFH
jgi:hypothetical protein